jgi:hypothetical protein
VGPRRRLVNSSSAGKQCSSKKPTRRPQFGRTRVSRHPTVVEVKVSRGSAAWLWVASGGGRVYGPDSPAGVARSAGQGECRARTMRPPPRWVRRSGQRLARRRPRGRALGAGSSDAVAREACSSGVAARLRDRQACREGVDRAMALFPPLAARRRQKAGLNSGGGQQMLSLARALATSPKLLIADEMPLGLAPQMSTWCSMVSSTPGKRV